MKSVNTKRTVIIAVIGSVIVALILVLGTIWLGSSAKKDTDEAVRLVSLLYLDELAGRREKVVEDNLNDKVETIETAISLMTEDNLSDKEHLEEYQSGMKKLFNLEKFAFVDTDGLIYTAQGYENNIDDYSFDYKTISQPEISLYVQDDGEKKVIIAVPVDLEFEGKKLTVCFMSIGMDEMLSGVSMSTKTGDATFCNLYTDDGVALTDAVLGGLAQEDNLLDAMEKADMENGYDYETFKEEFQSGQKGVVSFTYDGIRETLAYIPVKGTDWQLTYLIRESVITDRIGTISGGTIRKSIFLSVVMILIMIAVFIFILHQIRKNNRILLEHETIEAENRVKQDELREKLELQEKLLDEQRQREEQDRLITALSSDYKGVYYIELDNNKGVCYQEHSDIDELRIKEGDRFDYLETVTYYANRYVTEKYREEFLEFVQPGSIREQLKERRVISYTYTVLRNGKETYETVRYAGVRHPEDRDDHIVHNVGACFVDTDEQTRKSLEQRQALSDALSAAEDANKAKTAFLSNMSHEIRTPMNAIIGLDNIALNDPETPEKTKGYLKKRGASADHLLNLINDILDVTRIESGRLILKNEEFSFSKFIEAINTMFSSQAAEKGLDYQCHIIGDVDSYYIGDNMKLRQVFINIIGNAVKFTPSGGKIDFDVERTAKFEGKSTLRFRVSDTGIGISEEFIPKLFEVFTQEDSSTTNIYGSSGLGLAITKNIVEMMNGNIKVDSKKGEGTVFTVTVTLDDAVESEIDRDYSVHPSEMTVLIVDDDTVACEHAKLVLEKAGIASETALSGEKAIEMVKLRHARRNPYNLILVDWQMPDLDGIETTKRIREIVGHESAIIILTAYRWDDILDEAVSAGVDSFLSKPLFVDSVLEEFKSSLQRKNLYITKSGAKADLKGRRVLVAEDMQVNADIMSMVLSMKEIKSEIAENGKIALEKFESSEEGYYDAILMDIRMPVMDGLEATSRIRQLNRPDAKTIPIIALTANAFDEDVERSLQMGLNAHLSKPVQPEDLFSTLESLI